MQIKESGEDYLESILVLSKKQESVRATDICNYFGYARASVSVVIKRFRQDGYVTVDENNRISLTSKGFHTSSGPYHSMVILHITSFYFYATWRS